MQRSTGAPLAQWDRPLCHTTQETQLTISLNFFMGSALTVLEAGFALKTHGSLVKGFTPLRAAVAGFFFSFKLSAPPSLNLPEALSCCAASATIPSIALFSSLDFNPVFSAMEL